MNAQLYFGSSSQPAHSSAPSETPFVSTMMAASSQRPKGTDSALSLLNEAIDALNLAKTSSIAPANVAFGSTSDLLTTIIVGFLPVYGGRLLAK